MINEYTQLRCPVCNHTFPSSTDIINVSTLPCSSWIIQSSVGKSTINRISMKISNSLFTKRYNCSILVDCCRRNQNKVSMGEETKINNRPLYLITVQEPSLHFELPTKIIMVPHQTLIFTYSLDIRIRLASPE